MELRTVKNLLREIIEKQDEYEKEDIIQMLDNCIDSIEQIQTEYILLDRKVIRETR